ncbi:MAG TPA: ankyrin repeat domain-containing protein [Pirellulaceae bacterium]|nr:ankyrin repeat domain-containing protein [Pirellulaceae bacterium]
MRIEFSAPVVVTDENDDEITDPAVLSGLVGVSYPGTQLTDHFGGTVEEMPVAILLEPGGTIELVAGDTTEPVRAISVFRARRALSDDELAVLHNFVEGSWSDGAGSYLEHDDLCIHIVIDQIRSQQVDDGVESDGNGTSDLFPAIRRIDVAGVTRALDQGERLKSSLCGVNPLQWALCYANAQIALLLIERGVEIHKRSWDGGTVLSMCASSRDFKDQDAAQVASELLDIGGFEQSEWQRAVEIAELRGKAQLLAILRSKPIE